LVDKQLIGGSLMQKYETFHAIAAELDEKTENHSFLNNEVNRYRTGMHRMKIEEELYAVSFNLLHVLFLLLGLPFALFSVLVFWPMQLFTERFVHSVIKDTLFRNSIRISFWTFITPLYLFAVYGVLRWAGVESSTAVWLWLSIPAGLITLPWWRTVKQMRHTLRVRNMRNTPEFKDWLKQRDEVIQWLSRIPYLKSDV
jgi:hypothetical protein